MVAGFYFYHEKQTLASVSCSCIVAVTFKFYAPSAFDKRRAGERPVVGRLDQFTLVILKGTETPRRSHFP